MPARTYHDHVIKDGRFIGEFDRMYREFDDPWHQKEQPNQYARRCALLHMQLHGIRSVAEFGCGLGYYTDLIHRELKIPIVGYDISGTAIEKARERFPHLDLRVGRVQDVLQAPFDVDAILFAEIGWYILPDLDRLMELMLEHHRGRYFINNLVFYKGTQAYGTEYFTDLKSFIDRIPFKCVGWMEASRETDTTIETSTIFRIGPK